MSIRTLDRRWIYSGIRVISLIALAFAAALTVSYYFKEHTFCAPGASCDQVANSDFGKKYGFFLPILGLTAYSFFFLTSFFFARTKSKLFGLSWATFWVPLAICCSAAGAMLFIIVQTLEIKAFCWMCMGIDVAAITMVIPAILLFLNRSEVDEEKPASPLHPLAWLAFYVASIGLPILIGVMPPSGISSNAPDYIRSFYREGQINIVEISSFDCPHCRELHPQLSKLLAEYGSKINFTRLTIPLTQRKEACIAYICADKQKKSEQYANCLFEEPSKDTEKLLQYARECSIDETSFKACLNDPETARIVDLILEDISNDAKFKGAPTIWIENTSIIGFDSKKGITPYRNAIEKSDNHAIKLIENYAILSLIILGLLAAGLVLTFKRKKKAISE